MSDSTIVYVTFIKTTPEKLWEALTNNEFIKHFWFGSTLETDWKVGSKIKEVKDVDDPFFQGEILESDPSKRLAYTFCVDGEPDTEVSFTIEAENGTTKLTIEHKGYDKDSKFYKSTSLGWAAISSGIKTLLETGEPMDKNAMEKLFFK